MLVDVGEVDSGIMTASLFPGSFSLEHPVRSDGRGNPCVDQDAYQDFLLFCENLSGRPVDLCYAFGSEKNLGCGIWLYSLRLLLRYWVEPVVMECVDVVAVGVNV